jgi:hypothetical protein
MVVIILDNFEADHAGGQQETCAGINRGIAVLACSRSEYTIPVIILPAVMSDHLVIVPDVHMTD